MILERPEKLALPALVVWREIEQNLTGPSWLQKTISIVCGYCKLGSAKYLCYKNTTKIIGMTVFFNAPPSLLPIGQNTADNSSLCQIVHDVIIIWLKLNIVFIL